jgi:hypothetical protein
MNEQDPALPTPEPPAGGPPAAFLSRLLAAESDEGPLDARAGLTDSRSGPDASRAAARASGEMLWQIA